jgi:hypothetical protein
MMVSSIAIAVAHYVDVNAGWADRALFIWLYRRCPRLLDVMTIVRPRTDMLNA